MPDCILREVAIELLSQPIAMSMCLSVDECHHKRAQQRIDRYLIENIPAADVRPVVRGKWEKAEDFDEYGGGRYVEWTCSECFRKVKGGWAVRDSHIDEKPRENFCPNCGAEMEES